MNLLVAQWKIANRPLASFPSGRGKGKQNKQHPLSLGSRFVPWVASSVDAGPGGRDLKDVQATKRPDETGFYVGSS